MQYGFVIDNRKCIGCHACTVACKSEHDVALGVNRTWVKYIEKGAYPDTRRLFTVTRCNHCSDAPCVEICPVTSLYIRKDGIVDFDSQRCIGCKACMQACPYDALYIDPQTHTSAKCNYCAHRTERGLEPACVIVCPVQAIVSGDMENPESSIAQLLASQKTTVRKPEKLTKPKLFYVDADEVSLVPERSAPRQSYLGAEQTRGVGHFAHLTERLAERTGGSPGDLTKLLSLAGEEAEVHQKKPTPVLRAYDAPQKGLLWDWEVVAYVWTKSIAAGVLFLPLALNLLGLLPMRLRLERGIALTSLVFLALTGVLLVKDLDRPDRFLSVLLRPQWKSWLVRGAYIIGAYGVCGAAWAAHLFFGEGPVIGLRLALVVLGILTAIYTAFLFAQAKGRDLWQSRVLPLHMLATSAMTGGAVTLLLSLFAGQGIEPAAQYTLAAAIALHLAILGVEFWMPHHTPDTRSALAMMTRGMLRLPFWSGLVLGNALPLVLLLLFPNDGIGVFPACVLVLVFSLVSEHVWVRAPQLVPLR
jgi:Fe-S-cluster-containing dehydrogenase component/formate-dependent nitrite reductase membrane component NrfD